MNKKARSFRVYSFQETAEPFIGIFSFLSDVPFRENMTNERPLEQFLFLRRPRRWIAVIWDQTESRKNIIVRKIFGFGDFTMISPNILSVQFFLALIVHHASSLEREMTIQVQAKERECFFEKLSQ